MVTTPLGPFLPFFLLVFSTVFFVFFLLLIFHFFIFVHFFIFPILKCFFICFFHFFRRKVSSLLFSCISFKYFLLLALVSEFNCFLRSRCFTEMWCPDDTGRDSWDWVGPPAWGEHASTPQTGVEAPRLLKRSLSRLNCCCCVLLF